tara:strand:- start:110 stop:352 length:243 start_codon:yes stop_codon:yes gene_type:complete
MLEYTVKVWTNGTKQWWINGKRHREDGPAVDWSDGTKQWWINGEQVTEEEHRRLTSGTRELTVEQIEQLLGHKVKIVGED